MHDPARIRVKLVVLGNTREAHRLGYEVRDGRLVASHLPQVPTQQAQAAAKQRRERWRVAAQAEAASAREAADRSAVLTREAQRRAEVAEQKVDAMAQAGYGDHTISVVALDPPRAPAPAPPALGKPVSHNDCSCCFNV